MNHSNIDVTTGFFINACYQVYYLGIYCITSYLERTQVGIFPREDFALSHMTLVNDFPLRAE